MTFLIEIFGDFFLFCMGKKVLPKVLMEIFVLKENKFINSPTFISHNKIKRATKRSSKALLQELRTVELIFVFVFAFNF